RPPPAKPADRSTRIITAPASRSTSAGGTRSSSARRWMPTPNAPDATPRRRSWSATPRRSSRASPNTSTPACRSSFCGRWAAMTTPFWPRPVCSSSKCCRAWRRGGRDARRSPHRIDSETKSIAGHLVCEQRQEKTKRERTMLIGGQMFFTDYSMSPTELARALEDRGFDSLWVPEHSHIPLTRKSPFPSSGDLPKKYYDVMDPFVVLSAAAAVTKTLLLGTGICLIAQRDPIQTAKQVAS